MFCFYTKGFLTFAGGKEIEHWAKIGKCYSDKLL